MKLKLILLAALVAALAATCAGWKWNAPTHSAAQQERIAGWTWDNGADNGDPSALGAQ